MQSDPRQRVGYIASTSVTAARLRPLHRHAHHVEERIAQKTAGADEGAGVSHHRQVRPSPGGHNIRKSGSPDKTFGRVRLVSRS